MTNSQLDDDTAWFYSTAASKRSRILALYSVAPKNTLGVGGFLEVLVAPFSPDYLALLAKARVSLVERFSA